MKPLKALNQNTILLLLGQLISQLGDKVISLGLSWMFVKNHLEHHLPWFLLICVLPSLIFAGDVGKRVNRFGYLRTVIWTDFARAVLFFVVAAAVWWLQLRTTNNVYLVVVYLMGFLNGALGAYFSAGVASLPTQIAKDDALEALNGLMNSFAAGAGILGMALGALLYEWVGLSGVMFINALSFLLAVLFSLKIRVTESPAAALAESEEPKTPESSVGRGPLQIFLNEPLLRTLLLSFFAFNFFAGPLAVYVPVYAERVFHSGARGVSTLEVSMSLGLILGGVAVGFLSLQSFRLSRVILALYLAFAVCFLGFGFSSHLWLGSAFLFAIGCVVAWLNVQLLTFFQKQAAPQELASLMTAVNVASQASMPISYGILGVLLPVLSAKMIFLLSSTGMALVATVTAYFIAYFTKNQSSRSSISTEGTLC